MGPVIGRICL
ncbi:hypothetical protein E2C01_090459 [Portunus trituberculatus]|uniref:Uncharacterized protein n=1 Tax=Portunus trituberculatus TaxID=210409 RepID=A0A5B7JQ58_PORTR|nr:hypothetical protein [Portunus trituberculatus]